MLDIIQGKTTTAEASQSFDLSPFEVETWIDESKRCLENALKANPAEVKEQYERETLQ